MSQDGPLPDGMPSDEEMRELLAQMRDAPVEGVVVEVVNALLQAAQVKLGRVDARLLIDAVAAVAATLEGRTDPQLVAQLAEAVTQLRLAQVEAEGTAPDGPSAAGPGSGAAPAVPATQGEEGAAPPAAPASGPAPGPAPGPASDAGGRASRLWVPGR